MVCSAVDLATTRFGSLEAPGSSPGQGRAGATERAAWQRKRRFGHLWTTDYHGFSWIIDDN